MLQRIILEHPEQVCPKDGNGNTPLHLAVRRERVTSNVIRLLLDGVGNDPKAAVAAAARPPNGSVRSPLHLTACAGRSWNDGLDALLAAAPGVLMMRDPTTRLFPFMAAPVGERGAVDNVYRLLREGFDLVVASRTGVSAATGWGGDEPERPNKRPSVCWPHPWLGVGKITASKH